MNILREIQENLQAYLLNGNECITKFVAQPIQGDAIERLGIYTTAYWLRLAETLQKIYAPLLQLLGEARFEDLAFQYIAKYPSNYVSINDFGQHFSKFLWETAPFSQQPYLSEIAAFVWALDSTIMATMKPILTASEMAGIPQEAWPDLRLQLQPSVKLLTQQWNTIGVWQALMKGVEQSSLQFEQLAMPVSCAVWRKDQQPYYLQLGQEAAWALQMFAANQTFAEVCEGLTQWLPEAEVAQFVVNLLLQWINDKMFVKIYP